ncbi:hypothetical protein KUTeg_021326 [Tegillarca granosa]|uniref:Beta-galactosidase n=1 Tax=Tegillarca granosa TaxID=220873 RepID=A0ABQ9ECQ8_TEGGR|nr:hypothetical protein KUTeg_021326 [Tegillarca granosa]
MSSAPYVSSGSLTFQNSQFLLDGKPFRIFSGAMHYFRVPPEYWKDRLLKMKACGLNTVETYVAWNLHEEYPTEFNFSGFLDVRKFIQLAHEVGLYVIFRPGPYICAEWDFGGLPSWLLRDPQMKVRSNYPPYQEAADRFFAELLPKIVDLQHLNGGPIIAVQVENEFGSYSNEVQHLLFIKQMRYRLQTFQIWKTVKIFEECFRGILNAGASFNMYMFHGGTNFGFMSGANWFKGSTYKPDVTSYDYDAPLSEAGDVTPKYNKAREIIIELGLKSQGEIEVNEWLPLDDVLLLLGVLYNGQEVALFNWLSGNKEVKIPTEKDNERIIRDIEHCFSRERFRFKTEKLKRLEVMLKTLYSSRTPYILHKMDFFLCYLIAARLNGGVRTNGEENQCKWDVYSLDFNESFVKRLSDATWKKSSNQTSSVPSLFRGVLHLKDQPNDTFLSMKGWGKGVAFINGFNLGRYWEIGPQRTLFVPAPLLKQGNNEIMVFEQHKFYNSCQFQDTPLLS